MKKRIIIPITILIIFNLLSISSHTFYADEENNYGFKPDEQNRLALSLESPLNGFSSKYDPRENNYTTPVEDQEDFQLCWMYATTGAIEQHASLKYGSKFNISEKHGALTQSNRIIPTELNCNYGYYNNDYDVRSTVSQALQYFTNWNEPIFNNNSIHWQSSVLESSYQFSDSFNLFNDYDFQNANSILNVTDSVYLHYDLSTIKNSIISYGGAIASINYDSTLLCKHENNNNAYFNSSTETTPCHTVVIVGWDDNYPVSNFNKPDHTPQNNGAWLIRNSKSTDDNYFWLSYEEGSLLHPYSKKIAITNIQKSNQSEKMLSYDYKPIVTNTDSTDYTNDTVYFCNVYNTSDYLNNYNEITKVMMYLKSTGCTYQIRVVPLSDEDNLPTDIDNYSVLATGNCNFEGYITEELDYPVDITNADKCAIIIKLTPSSSDSIIYYPYEVPTSQFHINESFLGIESNNGISWNDCKTDVPYIRGNLCIRPVLHNSNYTANDVTISPTQVIPTNADAEIQVSSIDRLFNIHTPNQQLLREDIHYLRTDNGIILKQNYLNSLNGNYTTLILEFTNGLSKTLIINPKSTITNIQISGQPIVGETLTAQLTGQPEKPSYDVNYQWEFLNNGTIWSPISGATQSSYTIDENYYNCFLRVTVTPQPNGNVISGNTSNSTNVRTVILGDCDLDGSITSLDAIQIQKYVVGKVEFTERQLLAADFNKDGIVDIFDSNAIMVLLNT